MSEIDVVERFTRALSAAVEDVGARRDPADGEVDRSKLDSASPQLVAAAQEMVTAGLAREMGELVMEVVDRHDAADRSLFGYLAWLADRSKDPARAAVRPSVERLLLGEGPTHGRWSDVAVDQAGRPLVHDGEKIQSRWLGAAMLVIDDTGESKGTQLSGNVFVEKGGLRLAITDRRLIAVFNSASTKFWGIVSEDGRGDGAAAVLVASWPLVDIGRVNVSIKKRRFGRAETTGCNLISDDPFAYLSFMAAIPADETWSGSADRSLSSWLQLGEAIAVPGAQACLNAGRGKESNLRQVLGGSWNEGFFQGSDVMVAELAGLTTV